MSPQQPEISKPKETTRPGYRNQGVEVVGKDMHGAKSREPSLVSQRSSLRLPGKDRGTLGDTQTYRDWSREAEVNIAPSKKVSEPEQVTDRVLASTSLPPRKHFGRKTFAGSQLLSNRDKYPLQPTRAGQFVSTRVRPGKAPRYGRHFRPYCLQKSELARKESVSL